jgi:hypothetical protein
MNTLFALCHSLDFLYAVFHNHLFNISDMHILYGCTVRVGILLRSALFVCFCEVVCGHWTSRQLSKFGCISLHWLRRKFMKALLMQYWCGLQTTLYNGQWYMSRASTRNQPLWAFGFLNIYLDDRLDFVRIVSEYSNIGGVVFPYILLDCSFLQHLKATKHYITRVLPGNRNF